MFKGEYRARMKLWAERQQSRRQQREAYQRAFPITIEMTRLLELYRNGGVVPWMIWLGSGEYAAWLGEAVRAGLPKDTFDGVKIQVVDSPGVSVLGEPWEE